MSFLRRLNLSSRLLLGLMAVAAAVGVGSEVLRPGHHVHLGIGGHHHHWHAGPHSHAEEGTTEIVSAKVSCDLPEAGPHAGSHHYDVSGHHAEAHHQDTPANEGPTPQESDEGAFVDAFPLEEAASQIVLGATAAERGKSIHLALTRRTTAPPFLPITPRGPPHLLLA